MKGVRRFKDRLKKDLRDPEFRRAFDEEEVCVSLAIQIAKIRQKKNISCSLKTLIKVAHALDKRLKVELV